MSFCWLKHSHPSKLERDYCNWLRLREKAGEIKSFRVWPSVKLHIKRKLFKIWKADFEVTELDGTLSLHEAKGYCLGSAREFRIKAQLFMQEYPKIPLYMNRVRLDPTAKRLLLPGLSKRKSSRLNPGKGLYRTYDKELKRWVTKKAD